MELISMTASEFISLSTLSLALAAGTPSAAVANVRAACMTDIKSLCAVEYKARDKARIKVCLSANVAKASVNCQAAVRAEMAADKRKAN